VRPAPVAPLVRRKAWQRGTESARLVSPWAHRPTGIAGGGNDAAPDRDAAVPNTLPPNVAAWAAATPEAPERS
jgi:hypothetical protein